MSVEDLAGQRVAKVPPTFPPALWEALVPSVTPSGKPVPRVRTVSSITETWTLVARELIVHPTVAFMAEQFPRRDITLVPITDLPPIRLGLIWRTACCNARIRALATTAQSIYRPNTRPADS